MGLSILGVSKDYHWDEKIEDYVGYDTGMSTDIGYAGFHLFRIDLVSFCTNGEFESYLDLGKKYGCWYNDEANKVDILAEDFSEEELKDESVQGYLAGLAELKERYPKMYACYPLALHSDCEGTIPYTQLIAMLPVLKEYQEQTTENFGYVGRGYNWLQELIETIEKTIEIEGKLLFC